MCPAFFTAIVMLRARMVFEGRVQIKAACPKALCCAPGLPIPSHDDCAKLLLSLLRSALLATLTVYAAAAGALQTPPAGHQGPDRSHERHWFERVAEAAPFGLPMPHAPASLACASALRQAMCPVGLRRGRVV